MSEQTIPLQSGYKKPPRTSSLRARLLLANILIITVAIIGTGYYIYTRTNSTNVTLTNRLDSIVVQQARNQLTNTSALRAQELNNFFVQLRKDITKVGTTASELLSKGNLISATGYWDATKQLTQRPNGAWGNTLADPFSAFVPAGVVVSPNLISELETLSQMSFSVPEILKQNPDVTGIYFGGKSREEIYFPNVNLVSFLPPVYDVTTFPWYITASPEQNPNGNAVWSTPYLDATLHGLVLTTSIPVIDDGGNFQGVAAMDIELSRINTLVTNIKVGTSGYAFLIDNSKRLIAFSEGGYREFGLHSPAIPLGQIMDAAVLPNIPPEFFTFLDKVVTGEAGIETFSFRGTERYISYVPVPEIGYSLVIMVPSSELLTEATAARQLITQETVNTYSRSVLLGTIILIIAIVITFLIGNGLTSPLQKLTKTAEEITQGNINTKVDIKSTDEIGTLAIALNTMTSTLRNNIQSLEQKVEERTEDLVRKTLRLQAASQVAHDATEMQDITTLLGRTAELISSRFGFYHTGIFLLDEQGEFAVLLAASSEGGQRMLARGHRLNINQQGLVAVAARENKPYIIMDVEADKNFRKNPDLPLTRSEATLPLVARGKILGVLDIQSVEPNAFKEDDIDILRTMADQIGLAIQNARSVVENINSMKMLEAVVSGNVQATWGDVLSKTKQSYHYSSSGIIPVSQADKNPIKKPGAGNAMDIPITLRGQKIGEITLLRKKGTEWSEAEKSLAIEVSNQIGLALENARLLDETSRRADNEKTLTDVTTKIRSVNTPQFMIDVAKEELKKILGARDVKIRPFSPGETDPSKGN